VNGIIELVVLLGATVPFPVLVALSDGREKVGAVVVTGTTPPRPDHIKSPTFGAGVVTAGILPCDTKLEDPVVLLRRPSAKEPPPPCPRPQLPFPASMAASKDPPFIPDWCTTPWRGMLDTRSKIVMSVAALTVRPRDWIYVAL
jgi:hypothetical protein